MYTIIKFPRPRAVVGILVSRQRYVCRYLKAEGKVTSPEVPSPFGIHSMLEDVQMSIVMSCEVPSVTIVRTYCRWNPFLRERPHPEELPWLG